MKIEEGAKAGLGQPMGKCPKCRLDIFALIDDHAKQIGIIHSLPMCNEFERLSADEYAAYIRRQRTAS